MKLYFMKQDALDTIKDNLKTCYTNYYTQKDNAWINDLCKDVCGEDGPFQLFKEIPDFDLAPLFAGLTKGEIDLENCKIVFRNLNFLTESQAADERLWAGLTHTVFYDYMRKKWNMELGTEKIPEAKKAVGQIRTRFFFEGGLKAGFYRNTLSKCWWVGSKTFDSTAENKFWKLDALGSNDIVSKISEIFYSYNFSSNPIILTGICQAFKYFNDKGIRVDVRHQLRPSVQLLNAIGGGVILDCLSEDDVAKIFIDNINDIRAGKNKSLLFDDEAVEGADETDEEQQAKEAAEAASASPSNSLEYVTDKSIIKAQNLATNEEKEFKSEYRKDLLGKTIGYEFDVKDAKYKIIGIELNA